MTGNWSAIVINYNGATFLESCLSAIRQVQLQPAQVVVVDNASDDDSLLEMNQFPWATTLPQTVNRGFAGGANVGLNEIETDYAVVLNPDVELEPEFGEELVLIFDQNTRLGATGALLLYPDGITIQHAGGIIDKPLLETRHRGYGEELSEEYESATAIDFATGAVLGLRMEAIRQVGGFDEDLTPVYYEDVDLCVRLRERGWEIRYQPELRALHHEGVTLQRSPRHYFYLHRNRLRYALKHLTSEEWRGDFVPAEFERLRHQFADIELTEDWPLTSGAGAIDVLMRSIEGWSNWDLSSKLHADLLIGGTESLNWAGKHWDLQIDPKSSKIPLLNRFRSAVNRPVASALQQQRAFNDAVLQTLKAQERINREQLASILLFALLALDRSRRQVGPSGRIVR